MSDEDWMDVLDQIGAGASRGDLWQHLARAALPWSQSALDLLTHLVNSTHEP